MALKKARRAKVGAELNITSMMDMMTIILVFLLKSYGTQDISVAPSEDLALPVSTTLAPPEIAVNLVVTKSKIVVDGQEILALTMEEDSRNPGQRKLTVPQNNPTTGEPQKRGQLIIPLQEILEIKADSAKADGKRLARTGSDEHSFKGRLLIQCDKTLPFSVLREVMYTAGQAQFSEFKFVVYKQEG
jgi:biopolymer transport protein ExbD